VWPKVLLGQNLSWFRRPLLAQSSP